MSPSVQAGDRLGRYEIVRPLASGGMADVFVARSAVGRLVALKRIRAAFASDENFVHLFLREAKIAIGLVHPNIAQVLDVGEADGCFFLVMELIEGISLLALDRATRARGERLPLPVVAWVIERTARALHHAHTRVDERGVPLSIVHRDVSPQNILIDRSGEVKLIDFGVARAANAAGLTRPGITRGKYLYFSPEQIAMQPLDGRSDLYSLGIVFYEAMLGVRPYDGELVDVLGAISRGAFIAPGERDPALPGALAEICLRAMRTKADARWAAGQKLAQALERWAHTHAPQVNDTVIAAALAHYAPRQLEDAIGLPVPSVPRPPELDGWVRRSGAAMDRPDALAPRSTQTQPSTTATPTARLERTLRKFLLPLLVLGITAGGLGLFWLLKPGRTAHIVGRRPDAIRSAPIRPPPPRSRPASATRPQPPQETGPALPARPADGSARREHLDTRGLRHLRFALADARLDLADTHRFEIHGRTTVTMDGALTLAGDRVPIHKLLLLSRGESEALPPRFVTPPGFSLPASARSFHLLLLNPSSFLSRQWVYPEGGFEIALPNGSPSLEIGPREIIDPWARRLPYLRIDWNRRFRIRAHLEPSAPDGRPLTFIWVGTPIDLVQWRNRKRAGLTGDDLYGLVREHEAFETDGLGAVWLALAAGPEQIAQIEESTQLVIEVRELGASRLYPSLQDQAPGEPTTRTKRGRHAEEASRP